MSDPYIVYKDGMLWEVHCKGCGNIIRKMVPDDTNSITERVGNRTIVRERLVLACLPNYCEMLLEMSDGSKHVTPMCTTCAAKMRNDPVAQQALYDADVAQWESEGSVSKKIKQRAALSTLDVAPVIKEV